jgi:hypothetical protein
MGTSVDVSPRRKERPKPFHPPLEGVVTEKVTALADGFAALSLRNARCCLILEAELQIEATADTRNEFGGSAMRRAEPIPGHM